MSDMNGITVYNVYIESLERIKANRGDYRDQVIVKQWKHQLTQNEQIVELKKQLKLRDKTIGEQNFALEIFHSRESQEICGQSNVGSYLKGLLESDQILTH